MAKAHLTRIAVESFKSYPQKAELQLSPLTILVGPNNSGKSSWIQPLQLLNQTLRQPRRDVPLSSEGWFEFLRLRDLIHGRHEKDISYPGANGLAFELEWQSTVSLDAEIKALGKPDLINLGKHSGIVWLEEVLAAGGELELDCRLRIRYFELERGIGVDEIRFDVRRRDQVWGDAPGVYLSRQKGNGLVFHWGEQSADKIEPGIDWFLPVLSIDRRAVGPRHGQRAIYNAWALLFSPPTQDLKGILTRFAYLSSARDLPQLLFRPASVPPEELGPRGEYAAQMLHSRQAEVVHFSMPSPLGEAPAGGPVSLRSAPLKDAVQEVYSGIGVDVARLELEDLQEFGFRMFFGNFPVDQVGRGIWHLLPIIELGLLSDPRRFGNTADSHVAIEEPECHLHPKVQSRLAEWYVALARDGRRLIVETHSDHLVRRLRRMVATAPQGSELEKWLLENVTIAEITQQNGISQVTASKLTSVGDIEHWPAEFMDEAPDSEREIYMAALVKDPPPILPVVGAQENETHLEPE